MISIETARKIAGKNCFGIEDAQLHFGVKPTSDDVRELAQVPFSEETLSRSRDTHVLISLFPLRIADIRDTAARPLFYRKEEGWYNHEEFAQDRGVLGWKLIRKSPIEGSIGVAFDVQEKLLGPEEYVPSAQELVYAILAHYQKTGEKLFPDSYVRCSDPRDESGTPVPIGLFAEEGLHIGFKWDINRYPILGLASAIRPQMK